MRQAYREEFAKKEQSDVKSSDTLRMYLEVSELYESASYELKEQEYGDIYGYIVKYNTILLQAYRCLRLYQVMPISSVRTITGPTLPHKFEKAKLKEIVRKSRELRDALGTKCVTKAAVRVDYAGFARTRVERVCEKFHVVATELQRIYRKKQMFSIATEYDVQQLFSALLRIDFDDVRREEWTPSYAGGSARMDFLVLPFEFVVEIKLVRSNQSAGSIGGELLIDIMRYRQHPKCQELFCFIYDPNHMVQNPRGLEQDLEREGDEKLKVRVKVRPC